MSLRNEVALALMREASGDPNAEKWCDPRPWFGAADVAITAVRDNLKARLTFDEEGVIEMLDGGKGPLED